MVTDRQRSVWEDGGLIKSGQRKQSKVITLKPVKMHYLVKTISFTDSGTDGTIGRLSGLAVGRNRNAWKQNKKNKTAFLFLGHVFHGAISLSWNRTRSAVVKRYINHPYSWKPLYFSFVIAYISTLDFAADLNDFTIVWKETCTNGDNNFEAKHIVKVVVVLPILFINRLIN